MLFDHEKFRAFLWDIYGDDYWGAKSVPCPDEIQNGDRTSFDIYIERNLTMFRMLGHFAEFLAECS